VLPATSATTAAQSTAETASKSGPLFDGIASVRSPFGAVLVAPEASLPPGCPPARIIYSALRPSYPVRIRADRLFRFEQARAPTASGRGMMAKMDRRSPDAGPDMNKLKVKIKPRKPKLYGDEFFKAADLTREIVAYQPSAPIFSQGDPAESVMYIRKGTVKLSVVSKTGKEAIVGMIAEGDFFGEGCLAGQTRRMATATSMSPSTVVVIQKQEMSKGLHENPAFADRFLSHMLSRNIRIEEDLIDQLFNSSEKRLARALLLLARYGEPDRPQHVLPNLSQELLAEMVGTTRSRVNFFMNKFRRLGFIEYNGELRINTSLLTVVLHE
jgi:CRP-like cAMP-binding protein